MPSKAVKIECPYCQKKFSLAKTANHHKIHHPEPELVEFVKEIDRAKSQGKLKYKTYKVQEAKKSSLRSATNVLEDQKKRGKGIRSVVSAGAFGMGKKR